MDDFMTTCVTAQGMQLSKGNPEDQELFAVSRQSSMQPGASHWLTEKDLDTRLQQCRLGCVDR